MPSGDPAGARGPHESVLESEDMRERLKALVQSRRWEAAIIALIVVNAVTLGLEPRALYFIGRYGGGWRTGGYPVASGTKRTMLVWQGRGQKRNAGFQARGRESRQFY